MKTYYGSDRRTRPCSADFPICQSTCATPRTFTPVTLGPPAHPTTFHQKTPAIPHFPPNPTCRFHEFHAFHGAESTEILDSTHFHLSLVKIGPSERSPTADRPVGSLSEKCVMFTHVQSLSRSPTDLHETRVVPCLYREPVFFSQSTFAPLWRSSDCCKSVRKWGSAHNLPLSTKGLRWVGGGRTVWLWRRDQPSPRSSCNWRRSWRCSWIIGRGRWGGCVRPSQRRR